MNQMKPVSKTGSDEQEFRARVVQLITSNRNPAEAIEELSSHYRVEKPSLRMGLPKGEKKALGCYVQRDKTIYLANSESLYDPYVIIHEFYHHLRSLTGQHRGTEKHARDFALLFLRAATTWGSGPPDKHDEKAGETENRDA